MGLYLRQDDNRSDVQRKVAEDLQARLHKDTTVEYEKPENSYQDNSQTSKHLGVWLALIAAVVIVIVAVMVVLN